MEALSKRDFITIGLAIVIWAAAFASVPYPQSRLWGINHLNFLPDSYMYTYLAGGICVMLLAIPVFRQVSLEMFGFIAKAAFGKKSLFLWAFISVAALAIFWLFRMPIHLLGDSYSVTENIGNNLPVIYKWSEMGAIAIASGIAKIMPQNDSGTGVIVYEIISVISGSITIFFLCAIAYQLGQKPGSRLLIFLLSAFAGWIVLFFGYTENYPILWPLLLGYIHFGLRYITGKGHLIWPSIFLMSALVCHIQTFFFAASFPALLLAQGRIKKASRKNPKLIYLSGITLVIACGIGFFWVFRNSPDISHLMIPIIKGHPPDTDYWLVSPAHLLDIVNLYLLLVPLLPMLIAAAWIRGRKILDDGIDRFLSVLTAGGLVFVMVIDPKLGMGRDWDLFAFAGLPPLLLLGRRFANSRPGRSALFPAISAAALILVMPFVATNLNSQPALDNYKYLLNLDLPKSRVGISLLEKTYRQMGDSTTADSLNEVLDATYPSVRLMPKVYSLYRQGRYTEALSIVNDLARVDPYGLEIINARGLLNLRLGYIDKALEDFEQLSERGRYDSRLLGNLAFAYRSMGRYDLMLETLRRGQRYDPESDQIINGLMSAFFELHQYDSAIVYGTRLIEISPEFSDAYLVVGESAYHLKYYDAAKKYLTQFLAMAPKHPDRADAENILKSLK